MRRSIEIDPEESDHHRFAYELRRRRLELGWTQAQLGRRLSATGSYIGMIESMKRRPPLCFIEACDKVLGLQGALRDLHLAAWPPPPPGPRHFHDWATIERQAGAIQSWDPLLIPGMFQIEPYARQVLQDSPGIGREELELRVADRLQRRALRETDDAPMILSLIDESVLHRPMGDPGMMRQQLAHLLELTQHPTVTIQVVPYTARSAAGLLSPFTLFAPCTGGSYIVYVESVPFGRTIGEKDLVKQVIRRYDTLRAVACPKNQSAEIIESVMNEWT
jgi:transcriptional regulator with XRE-family HTH domain